MEYDFFWNMIQEICHILELVSFQNNSFWNMTLSVLRLLKYVYDWNVSF
jgi:hypothetical protein